MRKKYNIKDLMKNTDFEAQRQDEILKEWQEFSLYNLLKGKREKPCFNLKSKFFK